ncbi:hypothetical protein GCM10008171_01290 [Methylopila jiangsuensis]|uniref:Uncharacterized protein n=1 Tax=Methylopila jiangsuensis TaxID=586230 RepID=A0A9W6N253_9HYPH|nr:hypothetical protein [Methylopila jiangsuensis]MDR6287296.1 hypothetical protein [Methylopila jiangsuensis]GLK74876.1 hypothetical protein GCM10008171_01290 [Methylopila jiangsuensis]
MTRPDPVSVSPAASKPRIHADDALGGAARATIGDGHGDAPDDRVALWARRTGRGLALAATAGLALWALIDLTTGGAGR